MSRLYADATIVRKPRMAKYRRLLDGLNIEIDPDKNLAQIAHIDESTAREIIREADIPTLIRMAYGIYPDDEVSDEVEKVYAKLEEGGYAGECDAPNDPLVEARLAELGAAFEWTVPPHVDKEALLTVLRDARSARKLHFNGFGQMQCLPETGVARCLTLANDLGTTDAKVLVVGDDDLMSLTLAQLGFEVTAIDIDEGLIAFINREAKRLGLNVNAHTHDVLAPLEDNILDRYDAVLTDPMSYKDCQIAFLSRALAVTKPGGTVLCCVTPSARRMFLEVEAVLPIEVLKYRNNFNAYSYHRFSENAYRSDLLTLRKTDGPLPYPADVQIPFEAITTGDHVWARHTTVSFRVFKMGLARKLNVTSLRNVLEGYDEELTVHSVVEHDRGFYAHMVYKTGETMQLHADLRTGQFELNSMPGGEIPVDVARHFSSDLTTLKSQRYDQTGFETPNFVPAVSSLEPAP